MEAMDTSSTASDELVIAKRALDESLGDNFKKYLRAMRQWFTQQSTKEEFDTEVHHFLTPDSVKAHNRFLLALLNKCSHLETLEDNPSVPDVKPIVADKAPVDTKPVATTTATATEVPVKPKPKPVVKPLNKKLREKQKKVNFENRFDATSEMNNAYIRDMRFFDDSQKLSKVSYCQRESLLPDHFMSHLRVFVICWEMGLDGVQDNAVKLCNAALRDFMKSILTEMFASRSSYRLRDNRFKYFIGGPPINPYLKNSYSLLQSIDHSSATIHPETGESVTMRSTVDEATDRSMYWMACSGQQSLKRKQLTDDSTNLRHLLYCLKTNRNLIPVLSVQCSAYYRTAAKLEELDSNSAND